MAAATLDLSPYRSSIHRHDIHLHPLVIVRNISIPAFGLRYKEPRKYSAHDIAGEEDPINHFYVSRSTRKVLAEYSPHNRR